MSTPKALCFAWLFFASATAWADPCEDLYRAYAKLLAAKSFRATVTDVKKGRQSARMEFVAPNRYHMTTGQSTEQTIVGDDAWTNVGGRMLKLPVPVGKIIAQYRNEQALKELRKNDKVVELGDDMVDGEPAKVYRYIATHPAKADVKVWVSRQSGYVMQLESEGSFMGVKSTTRVRYSDFDDPNIEIALPKNA